MCIFKHQEENIQFSNSMIFLVTGYFNMANEITSFKLFLRKRVWETPSYEKGCGYWFLFSSYSEALDKSFIVIRKSHLPGFGLCVNNPCKGARVVWMEGRGGKRKVLLRKNEVQAFRNLVSWPNTSSVPPLTHLTESERSGLKSKIY